MEKWSRIKYQPCIPMGDDGRTITSSDKHIALSRKAAADGMVLLKNDDNILPLKNGSKVAVFGKAQIDYVKGGGGSGNVYSKYMRNIDDGLKCKENEGKIKVFEKTAQFYIENLRYGEKDWPGLAIEPEVTDELLVCAREFTDTAIVAICRHSGEGWDRSPKKGDFYLSDDEEKMITKVCDCFENVIAVIDVGGVMDTEWFKYSKKIKAALFAGNGGMEGGLAIADILTGDVNPSGKLSDTFAKKFEDYPSSEGFFESDDYVKYYDDIYVGYRYFETIPNAYKKVNYPFGFGLSYTDFKLYDIKISSDNEKIHVTLNVQNTGKCSGKEVVQVYYSAPQGVLGKPARELGAFQKTKLLAPDEIQCICMNFDINDMASYDDTGKLLKSAYILEKGDYCFYVGTSVRDVTKSDFVYNVTEDYQVVMQLSKQMPPAELEKRLCADGKYEELFSCEHSAEKVNNLPKKIDYVPKEEKIMLIDVFDKKVSMEEFIAQLDPKYMISLLGGQGNRGVSDTFGFGGIVGRIKGVDEYGIPCAMTCDGPAGVRIEWDCGIKTTAFPCATLLACTWDSELMYEVGKAAALEVKENNMAIWLAPGMNIHRNPLCGRNFEYFSEDPLLTGKMAASEIKGIQSQNIGACAKHFACNNKETNRLESNSIVSERALREIYLKGFEICVKEASPWIIMSSYNIINGVRASENYDMITNILRNEWGFDGLVTTDWANNAQQRKEILAGNDFRMPRTDVSLLDEEMSDDFVAYLQQSVKRLLEMLIKID